MRIESLWHKSILKRAVRISSIRALYLNNLLRGVAGSMVGIFFPAYVYLWGYQNGGMALGLKVLILSIALERGLVFLLAIPIGKLVYKIGFKYSILISCFSLSGWFVLGAIFPRSLVLIMVLSVVSAFTVLIYWLARLSILSIDGDESSFGEEVSLLSLIDQASSILGPFVGGILVTISGFGLLFGVATFICILSAIPIFFVSDYKIWDGISMNGFEKWLSNRNEGHLHWSFFGQGVANFVDSYFWPLFVFISVGSFTVLGAITSVTFAVSCIAIYIAGRVFDKKRAVGGNEDEKEYSQATFLLSLLTFFRPILRTVFGIFSMDVLYRLTLPFWGVDYDAYLYSAGKRTESQLAFYTYREMVYSMGRFAIPLVLLFFVSSPYFWWITFGVGSLGTLMTLGMQRES